MRTAPILLLTLALALGACPAPRSPAPEPASASQPAAPADPPATPGAPMTGATSPTGAAHPGTLVIEDKVDGTTKTENAADVSQHMAWVQVEDRWVAVTRIEVTGVPDMRSFTSYDAEGNMLEHTSQAPPPQPGEDVVEPVPVPTPE